MAPRITPLATLVIETPSLRSLRRHFTSTRPRHVGEQTGSYRPRDGLNLSRPSSQPERLGNTASRLTATYKGKEKRQTSADEYQEYVRRTSLQKLLTRRWKAGDVYAPHDLSSAEMQKWRMAKKPTTDAFDLLALNPLEQYKNFSIMGEYMTEMGRIKHSSETGLRAVNQRRIAKAIRRSIGMGLMPSVHKHPEILMLEQNNRYSKFGFT